jgi:hypothetical protein
MFARKCASKEKLYENVQGEKTKEDKKKER